MTELLKKELLQIKNQFKLSKKDLETVRDSFCKDMAEKKRLKMLSTHISPILKIKQGEYITIDLGGSNLRCSIFETKSNHILLKKMHTIKLKGKIKNYTTNKYSLKDLYRMILKQVSKLIDKNRHYSLVHTFSFSFNSISKNEAQVIDFAKGFNLKNSDKAMIHEVLTSAIKELGLNITITAIINDSVATLTTGNFYNSNTDIACIVGTGHNACFVNTEKEMINIESAYFNFNLPINSYDKKFIATIPKEAPQLLEVMVGGKYIGGVTQIILNDLAEKKLIGKTSIMTSTLTRVMNNKLKFGYKKYQKELLLELAKIVFERSALLISAEILGIIKFIDPEFKNKHNICFDGSVYEKNSYFRDCISEGLKLLCPDNCEKITHHIIKDASSKGAAIIAAEYAKCLNSVY